MLQEMGISVKDLLGEGSGLGMIKQGWGRRLRCDVPLDIYVEKR